MSPATIIGLAVALFAASFVIPYWIVLILGGVLVVQTVRAVW